MAGCGSKRSPARDDAAPAPPPRDRAVECAGIFDRARGVLAPVLATLGLHERVGEARARDAAGLAACARFDDAARTCLLHAPPGPASWATCKVAPPFVLYDGAPARDALLGSPVTPEDSAKRLGELVGIWHRPAVGLDDAITWKISGGGKLAARRTSKQGAHDEPPHDLAFARDRQLAIKTGTSTQFVPAFGDGDRLYLSWTSGAIAIPIPDEHAFALDLADHDRWVVWADPACTLVDPNLGATPITCAWRGDADARAFAYRFDLDGTPHEGAWPLRRGALVHPAMELFSRQRGAVTGSR